MEIMKEKTLIIISSICFLTGILIMFSLAQFLSIDEIVINKITKEDLTKKVKIRGVVKNIIDTESVAIIKVSEEASIDVILFKEDNESIGLKAGEIIEVIGSVEEYEENLEIIGQRVRVIR